MRACVSVSERAKARERPWGDVVGVGGGGVAWRAVASECRHGGSSSGSSSYVVVECGSVASTTYGALPGVERAGTCPGRRRRRQQHQLVAHCCGRASTSLPMALLCVFTQCTCAVLYCIVLFFVFFSDIFFTEVHKRAKNGRSRE